VKRLISFFLACLLGLSFAPAFVAAQTPPPPPPTVFSQAELDQLLAPIALYPDPLLSQILVAATYPLETVQAARFVRANPSINGDALAQAMQTQSWDPSVKALTQFPSVLLMMDDKLDWTQKLGDAFLAQQAAVMDTVQALRARAQAAGTLKSTEQQNVVAQDGAIDIDPYTPNTVYVPYYNPTVVYGAWWWPGWEPFVWVPPLAYQSPYFDDLFVGGIAFGFGIGIVDSLYFPIYPNWPGRNFINGNWPAHSRTPGRPWRPGGTVWTHDPAHRQGVAYRDPATHARFQPNAVHNANSDAYRGHVSNIPQGVQPNRNEGPSRIEEVRPAAAPTFQQRAPVEQAHPFMPSGSSSMMQSHSDRGRSSREGSGPGPSGASRGPSRR
jgi:hypothetical protein